MNRFIDIYIYIYIEEQSHIEETYSSINMFSYVFIQIYALPPKPNP